MTIIKQELKLNRKPLVVWAVSVGICCFSCLLLFDSLEDSMGEMAGIFTEMGSFSAALGLDKVNISTPEGFYATEVALIFALGGTMFAAMTGTSMLSKEEEGHTCDFLHALPFGRKHIVFAKYASLCLLLLLFDFICLLWILAGFACLGQILPVREFALYHGAQILLQLEIGSICFFISALCKRKQSGLGLGLTLFLYMADLICRAVPAIEKLKYVTPFYFSNATDIFTSRTIRPGMWASCILVTILVFAAAFAVYTKRDLGA